MYTTCHEHVLSLQFSCTEVVNSMKNLLSYSGLVDARISAPEKDLPVNIHCFESKFFYPLRFSEYVHGLAFAVNLLWNWCVTDCCDQSKTTFVVIFFQRATGAPETEVVAESGNSVPAGDLWSEAAVGLLHLPTFSMKGFMNSMIIVEVLWLIILQLLLRITTSLSEELILMLWSIQELCNRRFVYNLV